MLNLRDQRGAAPPQSRWHGSSAIVASFICIGLILLIIATVIIVSLLPIYLSQRELPVTKPSCSACSIDIRKKFTNATGIFEEHAGYYSCDRFCNGSLSSGAPGSDYPTYDYSADAVSALNGAIYSCSIAASIGRNCTNFYGDYTTSIGIFYSANRGVCDTPYGGYRCCCTSSSG
ncbi:hypothetical protein I4U23_011643 [Adineta vaga]|nr:hypothetical protein I4U23_011643 [Adineta vaga]